MADVELIAPTQKGNESKPLTEFDFNDQGYVEACPAGHVPERVKHKKKTDRYSAAFDPRLCQGCQHAEHCPVKPGKKIELSALQRQAISAIGTPLGRKERGLH